MKITGNKYALYLSSDNGNMFLLVSQQLTTDVSFNTQTVAKVGRNVRFAENRMGNQGGNGSGTLILNFASQLNYKELFAFWKNRTKLVFRIKSLEPNESNEKITEFTSYLTDVKKSSGMDAFVSVDISFTVDGEPRLIDIFDYGNFGFAFYSLGTGTIEPVVTTVSPSIAGWTINDNAAGQSNTPTLEKTDASNIVRMFATGGRGSVISINLNGCNVVDFPLLGLPFVDLTGNEWTNLTSFTAQQQIFTLKVGSWINKDNVVIDITNSNPNKEQIRELLQNIREENGTATNTNRSIILGSVNLDSSDPLDAQILDDIDELEDFNWTITTITKAAFRFTSNASGNINPVVIQSTGASTGFFVADGVTYNSDSPTIPVTGTTDVVYFNNGQAFIEQINLNGCTITGAQAIDFSSLTDLTDLTAINQDFDLLAGIWIRQAGVTIDITNSIPQAATNERPYQLIKNILIANGGTYSDDGSNFTGTAGQTHAGRSLILGTVVLDSAVSLDQITLDMITALQAVGWTITTILTLCNKFLDFYLIKNTIITGGGTARYEIPKNYTTNRPANSPILLSVDDSEIVPGTLSLKLFDTNGTTELASNFAAINTDLEANDRTGGFLEVSGLPNGDVAKVVITISDFPTVEKVCGAASARGIPAVPSIYLIDAATTTVLSGSEVTQWTDQVTPQFNATQSTASNRPILGGNDIVFDGTNDFLTFGNVLNNVLSGSAKFTFFVEFKINSLATIGFVLTKYADSSLSANERSFLSNIKADGSVDVGLYGQLLGGNIIVVRQSSKLVTGVDYRLAFSVDMSEIGSNKVKFSLNGVTQGVSTIATGGNGNPLTLPQTQAPLAIGAMISSSGASASHFNGSIRKVVLFDTVLTQTTMNGLTA